MAATCFGASAICLANTTTRRCRPATLLAAINAANLRAHWTNTVGLGFRIQTPFGGALAVDYGFLLNPPEFLIPQRGPSGAIDDFNGTPAIYRLKRTQVHFRFTQTF